MDKQMPMGPEDGAQLFAHGTIESAAYQGCHGECLQAAQHILELAGKDELVKGKNCSDIAKRFQFLKDVSGDDRHKAAEIALENALALYETAYGQESPLVAHLLHELAVLYRLHGNTDYALYLNGWADDMMTAHRDEPTHEFFTLFGYEA